MGQLKNLRLDLQALANPKKAVDLLRFFKTGKGQYGEGDKFLGIMVPQQRQVAKKYAELTLAEIAELLASPYHEARLVALLILVRHYQKTDPSRRREIYDFYLAHVDGINNWDLVDLSAPHIVGAYLFDKDKKALGKLVTNKILWRRRIAIIATLYFIRNNLFTVTLDLAKQLLADKEDLMHKATGWMLREVGKRDFTVLNNFLREHYQQMPRTMLRYAIERFPEELRLRYLAGKVKHAKAA